MSWLLSRVAEDAYWAARYLERAEDTARIVREFTSLIIDLPAAATTGWAPLLAILGQDPAPDPGERSVIELLICAPGNPSSIAQSVRHARENLRRCREIIPAEAWVAVNDLHLFIAANGTGSLDRRSRIRFLDHVIDAHQHLIGILAATMVRDSAFTLMRLGRHIERADMTTRLLDVQAGALLADRPESQRAYDDHQLTGILRALSAMQMFHRTCHGPLSATAVVSFILHAAAFPRSVVYCLHAAHDDVSTLPRTELTIPAVDQALATLAAFDPAVAVPQRVHQMADAVQQSVGKLHQQLEAAYFRHTGEGPEAAWPRISRVRADAPVAGEKNGRARIAT
jgi:uncharacterized alpha-E superfamily protein